MARILLIDDDEVLLRTMSRALRKEGHEVTEAGTGSQGLALAERELPDLVVTDINMPDGDGIEVVTSFTQRPDPIPVIAVSGGGWIPAEELLDDAGLLGAIRTLGKPFDLVEFIGAVRGALEDRQD